MLKLRKILSEDLMVEKATSRTKNPGNVASSTSPPVTPDNSNQIKLLKTEIGKLFQNVSEIIWKFHDIRTQNGSVEYNSQIIKKYGISYEPSDANSDNNDKVISNYKNIANLAKDEISKSFSDILLGIFKQFGVSTNNIDINNKHLIDDNRYEHSLKINSINKEFKFKIISQNKDKITSPINIEIVFDNTSSNEPFLKGVNVLNEKSSILFNMIKNDKGELVKFSGDYSIPIQFDVYLKGVKFANNTHPELIVEVQLNQLSKDDLEKIEENIPKSIDGATESKTTIDNSNFTVIPSSVDNIDASKANFLNNMNKFIGEFLNNYSSYKNANKEDNKKQLYCYIETAPAHKNFISLGENEKYNVDSYVKYLINLSKSNIFLELENSSDKKFIADYTFPDVIYTYNNNCTCLWKEQEDNKPNLLGKVGEYFNTSLIIPRDNKDMKGKEIKFKNGSKSDLFIAAYYNVLPNPGLKPHRIKPTPDGKIQPSVLIYDISSSENISSDSSDAKPIYALWFDNKNSKPHHDYNATASGTIKNILKKSAGLTKTHILDPIWNKGIGKTDEIITSALGSMISKISGKINNALGIK